MLRFLTAGESHGQALVAILEACRRAFRSTSTRSPTQLRRRQTGYGRGRRMAIESDRAQALSGIRHGVSTGAPIALLIPNKDWENWQRTMHVEATMPADATGADRPAVTRPRPGHADLAGFVKYGHDDMRNVLERASARETAARVAVGAIARQLLQSSASRSSATCQHRLGRRRRSARDQVRAGSGDLRRIAAALRGRRVERR